LGRAWRAVSAVGARAGGVPEVLQAVPALHPRGRAWRRPAADRRRRAGRHQLLRGPQLLGDLAHPGVAAPTALSKPLAVHVRVPPTSANLPPRFHTLALPLPLYTHAP